MKEIRIPVHDDAFIDLNDLKDSQYVIGTRGPEVINLVARIYDARYGFIPMLDLPTIYSSSKPKESRIEFIKSVMGGYNFFVFDDLKEMLNWLILHL